MTAGVFNVTHRDAGSKARAGVLTTPHGPVETPVFMPVGTQASVKTLTSEDVADLGYRIILGNTYHLFLRPGAELIRKAGGLHKFMNWPHAILTDSGGYQVFSLATRCKMLEDGVEFASHIDGSRHTLTPDVTTRFQFGIGSDIAMCLDDCPPYPTLEADAKASLETTIRWAGRCRESYDRWLDEAGYREGDGRPRPLLFGITQGAAFPDLRRESIRRLVDIGFPGYAVGGLGLGEPRPLMLELLEASLSGMPDTAPHYLMGFGQPEDMWEGVELGVDMFDCVLPTRNARNGQAFTMDGRLNVTNSACREDFRPIDAECDCLACRSYTRAYLGHLFRAGEMLAPRLVTLHNLSFMVRLLRLIRKSIIDGDFREKKAAFFRRFASSLTPKI